MDDEIFRKPCWFCFAFAELSARELISCKEYPISHCCLTHPSLSGTVSYPLHLIAKASFSFFITIPLALYSSLL